MMLERDRARLLVCLVFIFILGCFLRFYRIDSRCLSGDEVLTIDAISQPSVKEVWQYAAKNFHVHLPLFYTILHLWGLFSKSIFWLRTFSALSGLLLLLIAYKISEYLFNKKTALLVSFLTAISPFLILYSQTLRYYSFCALFNLVSLYFFIKAVHNNNVLRWFLYIVIRVFSIYINYSSFLFLFSEGLFILVYHKKYPIGFKRWAVSLFIIFLLWLPMSHYFFRDLDLLKTGEGFSRVPLKIGPIGNFFYSLFSFSLGQTVSPFNYLLVLLVGVIYLFIIISFFRGCLFKKISPESANFILLSLLIPIILCSLSKFNNPRYIIAGAMIYTIIISLGILKVSRKISVTLIIFISLLNLYSLYNLYNRKQYHNMEFVDSWDDIASFVKENLQPNSIILYNSHTLYYYLKQIDADQKAYALPGLEGDMEKFISEKIDKKDVSTVILADSPLSGRMFRVYQGPLAILNNWLESHNFRLTKVEKFDKDIYAHKKRLYINRPFPEYRTTVYIYSR